VKDEADGRRKMGGKAFARAGDGVLIEEAVPVRHLVVTRMACVRVWQWRQEPMPSRKAPRHAWAKPHEQPRRASTEKAIEKAANNDIKTPGGVFERSRGVLVVVVRGAVGRRPESKRNTTTLNAKTAR
jgi:hypothetical protein